MIQATQLRRGNTILMNGELYQVVDYQHITPGNWRGMVQTKLRKLSTGSIIDHRFRSEDRLERAIAAVLEAVRQPHEEDQSIWTPRNRKKSKA